MSEPTPASVSPSPLRFYSVVTLPAAALMALEIVSSRLLAPHFGNSVYVWGSIIGVFLGVMSAGYWIGGRMADQRPDMISLSGIVMTSAVCQAVILIFGRQLVAVLGDLTGGSPSGVLLATTVLFGPSTVFLAMVSPYAVKIATRQLSDLGGTAGHLYALSTAGSLVGTLGATFFLIPRMALEPIFATLLALTTFASLLGLGPDWRRHRSRLVLGIALLALAVMPKSFLATTNLQVVAERLSPYQTLLVQDEGHVRTVYSDGTIHSSFDQRTGETAMDYSRLSAAALLIQPEIETMAVLGMGAGGVGRYFHAMRPEIVVDHVDVDQAVADIAIEYFGFEEGPNHRIHIEDARRFLADRPEDRWDFIYADTYIGHSIPFHLVTREFLYEVWSHLAEGGVFGMNIVTDLDTPLSRGLLRGLSTRFRNVYIFQAPRGNFLFLATDRPDRLDRDELRAVGESQEGSFAREPEPSLRELAGRALFPDLDLGDAILLTDQYAPVNDLLRQSVDRSKFGARVEPPDQVSEPELSEDGSAAEPPN
ncbi:MAG: fused MFS/spermidine synthase [Thermoanaerobaculia bacterium]|nr:fused MFS/spermidine synthase [Thermoanaerobaculia bacterium]